MRRNLLTKVWELHTVRVLPNGMTQLAIGCQYLHEVTSPPAFKLIDSDGLTVTHPELSLATVDHIVPTTAQGRLRPFVDNVADRMLIALQDNCRQHGITLFDLGDKRQGIVHIIGPEQGLTQPGMTIVCGDSHTSTHGAFGAIAFGIGTTEVYYVLATQSLFVKKPKVRRINITGSLLLGVNAKDVILYIIGKLGVDGGKNYAYEYGGEVVDKMTMEQRMTLCNMTIEGGAQCGYVNPDQTTIDYLVGRPGVPTGQALEELKAFWLSVRSDDNAQYDDVVTYRGEDIVPQVTWGTNPGQVVGIDGKIPSDANSKALKYMGFTAGQDMIGTPIQHAFLGSCTNGRLSDLKLAVELIVANNLHVASGIKAYVVPGSEQIRVEAEELGYAEIFRKAGFDWRLAGCSSCLGMNPDTIPAGETCIASSNRNFEGRQGQKARTMLASVEVVVASACKGFVSDPRQLVVA